jgi:hypothetical protein
MYYTFFTENETKILHSINSKKISNCTIEIDMHLFNSLIKNGYYIKLLVKKIYFLLKPI